MSQYTRLHQLIDAARAASECRDVLTVAEILPKSTFLRRYEYEEAALDCLKIVCRKMIERDVQMATLEWIESDAE